MYAVKEAAELLGIPARVVRRLAQDGKLPGVTVADGKHGRQVWRLSEASLHALRELAASGPATAAPTHPIGTQVPAQAALEAPLPWPAVQALLHAERERSAALQDALHQALQRAERGEGMLREQLQEERQEVLRLRRELAELREQQNGTSVGLTRKSPAPRRVPAELAERPTEPIDLEQFRIALSQNEGKR